MNEETKGGFSVIPTSSGPNQSLLQWDFINGFPRRSMQLETELADLWATAGNAAADVENMGYNGLEAVKALAEVVTALKAISDFPCNCAADGIKGECESCIARALLARLKGGVE